MRIVLFGNGNLATRLGLALQSKHAEIVQVFGRNDIGCAQLAALLNCPYTCSKEQITPDADLFLLAVSESAIPEVLEGVSIARQLVVHTSGSIPMESLIPFAGNCGVFYPLQTLSAQKAVDFSTVPICIEANKEENLQMLMELGNLISDQVSCVGSNQRRQLHLAAVFVCNFVNHLYAVGEQLLREQDLSFDLLKPLIRETAEKAMMFSPADVQTGPAVRGNVPVLDLHQQMLVQHPEWQHLYERISHDISTFKK